MTPFDEDCDEDYNDDFTNHELYWKTARGEKILISSMGNSHIVNCLAMMERNTMKLNIKPEKLYSCRKTMLAELEKRGIREKENEFVEIESENESENRNHEKMKNGLVEIVTSSFKEFIGYQ